MVQIKKFEGGPIRKYVSKKLCEFLWGGNSYMILKNCFFFFNTNIFNLTDTAHIKNKICNQIKKISIKL